MTDWAQIFTGLFFMHMIDTASEKTGLWQLPIVSTVFNSGQLCLHVDFSDSIESIFVADLKT